jgi:hypothetical protein
MSTTTDRSLSTAVARFRRWRSTRARGQRIPPKSGRDMSNHPVRASVER